MSAAGTGQALTGAVEIRNLTFSYPGAPAPSLEDVSLTIPAGGSVGIVGEIGSGKSTLLNAFLQRGYGMLADDVSGIVLDAEGRPATTPRSRRSSPVIPRSLLPGPATPAVPAR